MESDRFRQLADEEKQAGIQRSVAAGSPAREYSEHVKCCHDTDRNELMMKNGFTALKNGTWEEYKETLKEKMNVSEWAFDRIKEAFDLVARWSHNVVTCAQTAKVSLWKTTFCGSLWEKPQGGGAQFVEKSTTGGNRTGLLVVQTEKVLSGRRSSKRIPYRRACAKN